ncbi:MAG: hypothetical protein PHT83_06580 [Bacilli bacterium]|nr:hypothetical protein [Bacilli bacterium]
MNNNFNNQNPYNNQNNSQYVRDNQGQYANQNNNQYANPSNNQYARDNQGQYNQGGYVGYQRPNLNHPSNQPQTNQTGYVGYQRPNLNSVNNANQPISPNQYGYNPFKTPENKYYQNANTDATSNSFLRQYLKSNPFFHDNQKNNFGILYLDNFLIRVKNKDLSVDELIKNESYSEERKIKYLKKTFRAWKKEYKQKKKEVVKVTKNTQDITGDVVCKKVKLKHRITLTIFLTIILIFGFAQGNLWDSLNNNNFFYKTQVALNNFFETTLWARILTNATVYLIIALFAFSFLLRFIIRDYRKYCASAKHAFREKKNHLEKNFSSKYRKARRHCFKRAKNESYTKLLDMSYIGVEENDLEMMNKINSLYTESIARVKSLKPLLVMSKWFLILSSYLGSIIVILCVIIEILRKVVF